MGLSAHELVGRNVTEFCHPEDLARLQAERDGLTRGRSLDEPERPSGCKRPTGRGGGPKAAHQPS